MLNKTCIAGSLLLVGQEVLEHHFVRLDIDQLKQLKLLTSARELGVKVGSNFQAPDRCSKSLQPAGANPAKLNQSQPLSRQVPGSPWLKSRGSEFPAKLRKFMNEKCTVQVGPSGRLCLRASGLDKMQSF